MTDPILVTSSRGTVGARSIERLVAAGLRVTAGVHARDRGSSKNTGIDEVLCDFARRASVQRALDGVQMVLLITPVCPESTDYACQFIDDAKAAGVRRIVRLSGAIASTARTTMVGHWHATAEDHLARSGIAHTILRPTLFMQNFATYYRPDTLGNFYIASGRAAANFVDVRDVVDVAVGVLRLGEDAAEPMVLTGPASARNDDIAEALSAAGGRKISAGRITPRQAALAMRLMGMPGWAVAAFKQIHELICDGFYDLQSEAVGQFTGSPPRAFSKFASDYASVFSQPGAGWISSVGAQMLMRVAPK